MKEKTALAAALLLSTSTAFATDLNEDDAVNVADIQCLAMVVANGGYHPCATGDLSEADLNCDGTLNISDVQLLSYLAMGSSLPSSIDSNDNGLHDACDLDCGLDGLDWEYGCLCDPAFPDECGDDDYLEGFDDTDVVLFDLLEAVAVAEQTDMLWPDLESGRHYIVSQLPMYLVRANDDNEAEAGYLFNFPNPPAGAIPVAHDHPLLGTIHRYDGHLDEPGWHGSIGFDFDLDIEGRPTFAMRYRPFWLDPTPPGWTVLPYSRQDAWLGLLVHEGFHHYQFHAPDSDWYENAWGGATGEYPVTADNIALATLERKVLVDGLMAQNTLDMMHALTTLCAIRQLRESLPEAMVDGENLIAMRDRYQERVEGSAHFVERSIFSSMGNEVYHQELSERLERKTDLTWIKSPYSAEVYFTGGYYPVGDAIIELIDRISSEQGAEFAYQSELRAGVTPMEYIESNLPPMSEEELSALVEDAKAEHDWDAIVAEVATIPAAWLD
jgi:hypothetical protein